MRFSLRKSEHIKSPEEDQVIDSPEQVEVDDRPARKPRRKRTMLTISKIDEDFVATLKARAKARNMPLYKYCIDLLRLGLKTEDVFIKRRWKRR